MRFLSLSLVVLVTVGFSARMAAEPQGIDSVRPMVVSHRGSTEARPENTLAALAWAQDAGIDAVEVDLRVSADGHIVVIHDRRVNRTTNGRGRVHRLSLAELKSLDAGNGERLPTLAEILEFSQPRDLQLLLDIKDNKRMDVDDLVGQIRRYHMIRRVVVGSRSALLLEAVKSAEPNLTTLAFVTTPRRIPEFVAVESDIVRLWATWTMRRSALVAETRAAGPAVWINTGRFRGRRLESIDFQDVQGVITDFPAQVLDMQPLGSLALRP